MKKYIVKFHTSIGDSVVTMKYDTYEEAHTVWKGMCQMYNHFQVKLIVPMVEKVKKAVTPLFDRDDLEAAAIILEEAGKGCIKCLKEIKWVRKVLNYFRPRNPKFKYGWA